MRRPFFFVEAPAERLAALRLLVGAYAVVYLGVRFLHLASYAGLDPTGFHPVGVVSVLTRPLLPAVVIALVAATALASLAFVAGWRFRLSGPLFAALLLWVLTYANSFGKILHTDNLFVLQVAVLALSPAADAWSLDARAGRRAPAEPIHYGWPIRLLCAVCVMSYLVAGLTKLENSGLTFLDGITLRNYVAFDNCRKLELGSIPGPLGAWLLPHPFLFRGLAAVSLALELGGPLALLHRRVARVWIAGAWAFHVGVAALMGILFIYPLSGVAFTPFFEVERLVPRKRRQTLFR